MSTRYIEINDKELKELVVEKGNIVEKGRKHFAKMEKLHEEGNAIATERNEVVTKIISKTAELLAKEELGEFELAGTTDIKDGVVRVSIIDRVAQFKANLRAEKEKAERKEAGELTEAEVLKDKQALVLEAIGKISEDELSDKMDKILEVLK